MADIIPLDEIEATGIDEYPADASVKLNGPPGTGKTIQSAKRVALLLSESEYDYELDDVLWGTYRYSLAMETIERLDEWGVIPHTEAAEPSEGATRFISTIHAVANRLVGGVGDMANGYHRRTFAGRLGLRYTPRNDWDDPPGQLLFDVFDYAEQNCLDLSVARDRESIPMLDDLRNAYNGDIAQAKADWEAFKDNRDIHDFWEQLRAPLDHGVTPSKPVVVIDEYHDAFPLMARLADDWITNAEVAIVAGDHHQAINTYAGANPAFFRELPLPEILLDTTWRVPEEHWAVATRVLSDAHTPPPVERKHSGPVLVGDSPTFTHSQSDGEWRVPDADTPRSPAWFVDRHGGDTMFLTRTRKQADGVATALERAGVLFDTQQTMSRDGWGAADADAMAERTALFNALQRIRGVEPPGSSASKQSLRGWKDRPDHTPEDVRFRHREAAALLDHANADHLSVSRAGATTAANSFDNVGVVVSGNDFNEYVTDRFWAAYGHSAASVDALNASSSAAAGSTLTDANRDALRAALRRNANLGPITDDTTLPRVYTAHASKGTEAETVVVYDGITGRTQREIDANPAERQNEHRVWYVALTRAKTNLYVLRDGFDWMHSYLPDDLADTATAAYDAGINGSGTGGRRRDPEEAAGDTTEARQP